MQPEEFRFVRYPRDGLRTRNRMQLLYQLLVVRGWFRVAIPPTWSDLSDLDGGSVTD